MKRLLIAASLIATAVSLHADPLVWDTPLGTFGLPFTATEALIGYDAVVKQAVAGFSVPVWTDPKNIVSLQVGAVAPWQNNDATIQPYIAAGHDILRDIAGLSQYKSIHLNIFGRYDTAQGKAGAGVGFSYAFAGGSLVAN